MLLLATSALGFSAPSGPTPSVPDSFDCSMRKAAYAFGRKLLPRIGDGFPSLYYALNLNDPACSVPLARTNSSEAHVPIDRRAAAAAAAHYPQDALYVCPTHGDDGADGRMGSPLRSIQAAVDRASESTPVRPVVLRGGTHFLDEPITLTSRHSGLRMLAYAGESPLVSGGKSLRAEWEPFKVDAEQNIWVADVSGQVSEVPGLHVGGVRATRARYPNLPGGIEVRATRRTPSSSKVTRGNLPSNSEVTRGNLQVSPGYGAMISGNDATWTPPRFDRYGNVSCRMDSYIPSYIFSYIPSYMSSYIFPYIFPTFLPTSPPTFFYITSYISCYIHPYISYYNSNSPRGPSRAS